MHRLTAHSRTTMNGAGVVPEHAAYNGADACYVTHADSGAQSWHGEPPNFGERVPSSVR